MRNKITDINDRAVKFWLDAGAKHWFAKSDEFDAAIKTKFASDLEFLVDVDLSDIFKNETDAQKMIGLLICLDQFRRNLYRNDARAFAQDYKALAMAQHIQDNSLLETIDEPIRMFAKMPYMHSEDLQIQEQALIIFEHSEYAVIHYDIIKQFGRFPHRNVCLGRESTSTELEFLANGGFSA